MPTEPYKIGKRYRVTMVRGWWLQDLRDEPDWVPVMGPLHEDTAFFSLSAFHYHVDPRFLNERLQRRVEADRARYKGLGGATEDWHPSYSRVLTNFPSNDRNHYISIDESNAYVLEKTYCTMVTSHPRQWGIDRMATRTSRVLCRAELPEAHIEHKTTRTFLNLRKAYGEPSGDRCPHRGYDLRSVPIDADGCRQCPLHQLRVRAPQHADGTPVPTRETR